MLIVDLEEIFAKNRIDEKFYKKLKAYSKTYPKFVYQSLVQILDYKANGLDLKEGEVGPNGQLCKSKILTFTFYMLCISRILRTKSKG